ncbi:MAG TPA: hypothetical protein PKE66_07840 [Pyrinomonadaceae bacterium]|mgnify:FL=1|nr:hypothetical protein [Pyrinomonadaceae bacterium]
MLETTEKTNELKTLAVQKDTWILEVPPEVCKNEGFAEGTLISLTLKNDSISGVYLKPSKEIDDFVSKVVDEELEYFQEIKRIGD